MLFRISFKSSHNIFSEIVEIKSFMSLWFIWFPPNSLYSLLSAWHQPLLASPAFVSMRCARSPTCINFWFDLCKLFLIFIYHFQNLLQFKQFIIWNTVINFQIYNLFSYQLGLFIGNLRLRFNYDNSSLHFIWICPNFLASSAQNWVVFTITLISI